MLVKKPVAASGDRDSKSSAGEPGDPNFKNQVDGRQTETETFKKPGVSSPKTKNHNDVPERASSGPGFFKNFNPNLNVNGSRGSTNLGKSNGNPNHVGVGGLIVQDDDNVPERVSSGPGFFKNFNKTPAVQ